MHFPLISQTSLLALAITLLQIPTAAGDFTLWTVDEVVMDCDLPTTCKPIQSGLWVAGGPGRDNIDHDCPDALDGTAYTADGDVLTGVTDDTTEVVFPNGLCGATGRFSCVKNGDTWSCQQDDGQFPMTCTTDSQGTKRTCENGHATTDYITEVFSCTGGVNC